MHTLALGPSLPQGHTCSLPRGGVQGVSVGRMGGWCDYGLSPRRVSRSPQGSQMTLPAPVTLPRSSGEKGAAAQHSLLPPTESTLAPLI